MGLFLLIALLAWGITKTIHDGRVDHTYAKQGLVSPRLQAKYGDGAAEKTARYGFFDYLEDAWSDHWQSAAKIRAADRQMRVEKRIAQLGEPSNGDVVERARGRVTWRQRWARAREGMARAGRVLVEPVGGDKPTAEPRPEPVTPLVESGDVPVGTVRHTDDGREQWDGDWWEPVGEPEPCVDPVPLKPVTKPPIEAEAADEPADTTPAATIKPTGGPAMTAPTGEAVNYETTVNELEAQARVQREHLDACIAAEKKADELADAVDGMQETYRSASEAAGSHVDHLTNLNLDGTTVGHVADTADALPAGRVDAWFAQIEEVKAAAVERRQAAEVALASTEAALAHVQQTYGDANATVAENLGGDARFLDGGAGTTTTQAATPADAPAAVPQPQEPVAV